jgi:hypothetical protein
LQERITDITSKVKNILETNDEKEPNVSGDDEEERNSNNNNDNFTDDPHKNDFNFNKVSILFMFYFRQTLIPKISPKFYQRKLKYYIMIIYPETYL